MSSVVRPSGPLPSRVYWVRRLVLAIVLAALVSLVWWFVAGLGGADGSTQDGAASEVGAARKNFAGVAPDEPSGSTSSEREGKPQAPESPRDKPERGRADNTGGGKPGRHDSGNSEREPEAVPTGECEAAEVSLEIVVGDAQSGEGTAARLKFTSLVEPACSLGLTADSLALRVTSGPDTVWTSQQCPDSVLAQQLVVRQDKATVYAFDWDGRRSVETCQSPGDVADAGGYWLEAALVGAEIEKAYFEVA